MPLVAPTSGTILDILNRLISLIEADSATSNLYTKPARKMPPDNIQIADGITVAFYSPDGILMPHTLNQLRISPRVIMAITIAESAGLSASGIESLYTQLMSVHTVLYTLVWKYRRDTTQGDVKWYKIRFITSPTSFTFERKPQEWQRVVTQFEISTEKDNP